MKAQDSSLTKRRLFVAATAMVLLSLSIYLGRAVFLSPPSNLQKIPHPLSASTTATRVSLRGDVVAQPNVTESTPNHPGVTQIVPEAGGQETPVPVGSGDTATATPNYWSPPLYIPTTPTTFPVLPVVTVTVSIPSQPSGKGQAADNFPTSTPIALLMPDDAIEGGSANSGNGSPKPWLAPPCRWHKRGGIVSAISPNEAFAMCNLDAGSNAPYGGALFYRTKDRGKHWSITGSPPQDLSGSVLDLNLTGFFFLDKAHGWYSNYVRLEEGATDRDRFIGLLRATTDGGRTWKSVATSDQAFYALRFVTPLHGYAHYPWPGMGSAQSVVETRDGGATWTSLSGNPGGPGYLSPLANPVFFDATNGITVGGERDVGAVVRTTDGGQSWTRVGSLAKACGEDLVASIDNLSFPDSRHGWVLAHCLGRKGKGLRPIFARTTDTGRTWINLPTSVIMQAGKGGERLKVVSFIDRSTGYASTDNRFLVTDDAGKSFVPTGSPILWDTIFGKPHYENHVLSFANGNQGWAAERFRLFSTVDGGLNWDQVFADYWIQPALSALPSGRAWVLAGNTGSGQQHPISLLATSDRGVRWVRYQFSETVPVTVSFGDTQHGWIVDEAGYLYRTTDGGTNWVLASGP